MTMNDEGRLGMAAALAPDDMAQRAVAEVLTATRRDALGVLVDVIRENVRLRMELASMRGLCGRCGKPGAAGAAGLCAACNGERDYEAEAREYADGYGLESGEFCRGCGRDSADGHASDCDRPIWAIRALTWMDDDGAPLYWSNELGWVGGGGGTTFSTIERNTFDLPIGGVWVCALCGQGDPTSPQHICR